MFGAYARSAALSVLVTGLIVLTFLKGTFYGMDSGEVDPSWRYRVFGVSIALSQIYYGRPYDYVGYKKIEGELEASTGSFDTLAVALRSLPDVGSAGLFYILNDDKGIVDFTRLAFLFFGIRTASLYYMYFTLLTASCLLFIINYFGDRQKMALLALFAVALYSTMPAFVARKPGISILDLHTFGILSFPAALHILLSATTLNPVGTVQLATTILQALFITFVCHMRFSCAAQVATVLFAYPALLRLFLPRRPSRFEDGSNGVVSSVAVSKYVVAPAILAAVLASLTLYQRAMYNPAYFSPRMLLRHPIYHNLLIGMQWNPYLRNRYGLGYSDLGAAGAVDAFLQRKGINATPWGPQWAALGMITVTTQQPFDWARYEDAARELYRTIWREAGVQSMLTYIFYHPRDIFLIMRSYVHAMPSPQIDVDEHLVNNVFGDMDTYRPFGLSNSVLVTIVVLIAWGAPRSRIVYPAIAFIMWASALLVPVVFYAGGFVVLAEAFVATAWAAYVVAAAAGWWLLDRPFKARQAHQFVPA